MYIVTVSCKVIGLFTSHTDAAEVAKGNRKKKVWYCPPNSTNVFIWDGEEEVTPEKPIWELPYDESVQNLLAVHGLTIPPSD